MRDETSKLIAFNNIYGLVELGTKSEEEKTERETNALERCSSLCFTANLFIKHKRQSHTNYLTSIANAFFPRYTHSACAVAVAQFSLITQLRAFFSTIFLISSALGL